MDILGEDEATAAAREAEDRAWIQKKIEACCRSAVAPAAEGRIMMGP